MAIGLTPRQRADLAAMLPNVEESVSSLKRLIADAKDRTRALQKLDEAEASQKRHASDVGIPFNSEAFAQRRAELNALPKMLTVEEGQLASFSALQRAIGVILEGPYQREGRASGAAGKTGATRAGAKAAGAKRAGAKGAGKSARGAKGKSPVKRAGKGADRKAAGGRSSGAKSAPAKRSGAPGAAGSTPRAASKTAKGPTATPPRGGARSAASGSPEGIEASPARVPVQKPLPLALGS